MAEERYRHVYLEEWADTRAFTTTRGGPSSAKRPPRECREHAAHLRTQYERAWERSAETCDDQREGVCLEFVGEPGFALALESLELRAGPPGGHIRLRRVRTDGEPPRTLATVYVPKTKRGVFLAKLDNYANELTKTGAHRHAPLMETVSDVRAAVLASFWDPDEYTRRPGPIAGWVEAWLALDRGRTDVELVEDLTARAEGLGIAIAQGRLRFSERVVVLVLATDAQLDALVARCDDIAEFRLARALVSRYVEMQPGEQAGEAKRLLARCDFRDDAGVRICILDTGVNNRHALLSPVLSDADCHTAREQWGSDDRDGHGTLMAGLATYGDLIEPLSATARVEIPHRIESAKVFPGGACAAPDAEAGASADPRELWGYLTLQAVSRAEIERPNARRVSCLAVTAPCDDGRGRPSSWSGAVDSAATESASEVSRLIIVSGGNADPAGWPAYHDANRTDQVEDPAQAWNALTVGACTEKWRISDTFLEPDSTVAPRGGLSPHSTTSLAWDHTRWPIKPDVLFEGGNIGRRADGSCHRTEDLELLSTWYRPHEHQFATHHGTSAATALAARMAAVIQAKYPDAWPETLRGLIVHSAEWTPAMLDQFLGTGPCGKGDYADLLRICGYGVPDLGKALHCLRNSLTLVSQESLQPFERRDGRYATRDMHLYELPWPQEALRGLGSAPLKLRVTLSYFVEPSPGQIGWQGRYRYASHGLRFEVKSPSETRDEFLKRINRQERDDGEKPGTGSANRRWTIGKARDTGSIHSDVWTGTAADLATSNIVAVYPVSGWWKDRPHLGCWNRRCRYSLVVSIHASEIEVDLYTPVKTQVEARVPVPVMLPTSR